MLFLQRLSVRRPRLAFPLLAIVPVVLLLAFFGGLTGCNDGGSDSGPVPGQGKIAVYNGVGAWDTSAVAVRKCLEYGGREVVFIDEQEIQRSLDEYSMVVIAAGDPREISSAITVVGCYTIKSFVERGGAYLGLGAGGYLAADSMMINDTPLLENSIELFHGVAAGPIESFTPPPGYDMELVDLSDQVTAPPGVLSEWVLYYGGPMLLLEQPSSAVTLGVFNSTDTPAGFRFEYGFGRVVILSVQPEIEENDDRDGSDFGSELNDSGSDWPWLLNMVEWAFHERS